MVKFFVKKNAAVFVFAILIVIAGITSYTSLPKEAVPEIKQPYIFVSTVYAGVAAKDIESLVTRPIEDKIDGLEGLEELSSSSRQSLSFIFARFASDVDVETALRRVKERVDLAKPDLPEDANDPVCREFSSSDWPMYITVMSNPNGLDVIDKAAELVEDRLKRINGVLDVDVAGRLTKEVAIELDPAKLEHYKLSINDVMGAIRSENVAIPGGTFKTDAKNYSLSVTGEIKDPSVFEDIIVKSGPVKVRLGELGKARFKWADSKTYSRLNGKPAISFSLKKRSGENIIYIVNDVRKAIKELQPDLPKGTVFSESYDQSRKIKDIILDLENNIITAFLLVMAVTIFFLGFRNSVFVSLAIPFSMLLSFSVIQFAGMTLNMVVLFSLVLALGMLVDNGIVIVENIFRHAAMGKSRIKAAIDGTQEVSWPVITSTITTVLAFLPIIFMPGVMGDFMSYLPKTVIIVLGSSLFVALTVNPVFCATFMSISEKNRKKIVEGSGRFIQFQKWYERRVRWAVDHSLIVVFFVVLLFISGLSLFIIRGKDTLFFPNLDPGTAIVEIDAPEGYPLEKTDMISLDIEKQIPESPASLKHYQTTTGRGASDDKFAAKGEEFNKANIRVEYKSYLERKIPGEVAIDTLKNRLKNYPNAKITVKAMEEGPPQGNDISYEITGEDYSVMGMIADTIMSVLKSFPDLKIVDSDFESAKPEIVIDIDRHKASFYGLSTSLIASTIRNSMNGGKVGTFRQGENEFDIMVRYDKSKRKDLSQLSNLQIVNHDDMRIPLSSVATIKLASSTAVIKRRNLRRAVQVWADFHPGAKGKRLIAQDIKKAVSKIKVPAGYTIGTGNGLEIRKDASSFLMKAFGVALFFVFIVLIIQFNSILQSLIIMVTILLSFGGVFWGYALSGQSFVVIMSGIGVIALAGVVVNNCIVLIDYTNLLIKSGTFWHEAVIEAGKTRLRPVLLTAITTVLGLLPMALGVSFDFHKFVMQFGSESGQYFRPLAWSMIYGLTFATVITLIVVPCFLSIGFRIFPPRQAKEDP